MRAEVLVLRVLFFPDTRTKWLYKMLAVAKEKNTLFQAEQSRKEQKQKKQETLVDGW